MKKKILSTDERGIISVCVIMLGYNDKRYLNDAITSVLNQSYKRYEFWFTDNASTDGSSKFVCEQFDIKIIKNKENIGYTGAYNQVVKLAFKNNFDAVVLLNADVVVDECWLEKLVESAYSDTKIGIVQPKIYLWNKEKTTRINTFGNSIHYLGFGFCAKLDHEDDGTDIVDKPISFASGCCMLIKKETWQDVGGFDESFFCYAEDQDISWRARLVGYSVYLSVRSKLWHKYNFAQEKTHKYFYLERNRLYFLLKNFQLKTLLLFAPVGLLVEIGVLINSIHKRYFIDKVKSYFSFFRNMDSVLRKRQKIQIERKVYDRFLKKYLSSSIDFKEINSPLLKFSNKIFESYYQIVSRFI